MRRVAGLILGQPSHEQLEAVCVEVLDDRVKADLTIGAAQSTHDMAEVALGLAQVVRLGETLAGQHLVGDLGLAAAGERVVDPVPSPASNR